MGETRVKKTTKKNLKIKDDQPALTKDRTVSVTNGNGKKIDCSKGNPDSSGVTVEITPTIETSLDALNLLQEQTSPEQRSTLDSSMVALRHVDGRGVGLYAVRKIPAGTLVMMETPLIRLTAVEEGGSNKHDAETVKEQSIKHRYRLLSEEQRSEYNKLHDTQKAGFSKQKSIFYSNCYNLARYSRFGGACIGQYASRINHSCVPNVQFYFEDHIKSDSENSDTDRDAVLSSTSEVFNKTSASKGKIYFHAIKDIAKNKEILSSYEPTYRTRAKRQGDLLMHYKFECVCLACSQQGFWADSDMRRLQMIRCLENLKSAEASLRPIAKPSSHQISADNHCSKSNQAESDIAFAMIETEKLIALLRKEGGFGDDLARAYKNAAKWSYRSGNVAAAEDYLSKERDACMLAFGKHSKRAKDVVQRSKTWWRP